MQDLQSSLAEYIEILSRSAKATTRAEDRRRYTEHLAAAAEMFAAIRRDSSLRAFCGLLTDESASFGRDFLSGEEGAAAEAAFAAFAAKAGSGAPAT